ncbi:Ribonuclease VapC [Gammaproteobacteria bacterium]
MSVHVLDASAVLAVLRDEDGADAVIQVLASKQPVLLGVVNALEVCYDLWRSSPGVETVQTLLAELERWPITLVREMDDEWLLAAARFKARGRLSLADACALGLAKVHHGLLVTADHHEFDPLEKAGLAHFYWIR